MVLSYTWLSFLVVVQEVLVRACCGKLRPLERMQVTKVVLRLLWSSFVYANVVLAPKVGTARYRTIVWYVRGTSPLLSLYRLRGAWYLPTHRYLLFMV